LTTRKKEGLRKEREGRLPERMKAASPTVFDPWLSHGSLEECRGRSLRSSLERTEGPREDTPPLLPEDFNLWRKFLESMESFGPKRMCSSITWNSSSGRTRRHIGNYNSTRFLTELAIL